MQLLHPDLQRKLTLGAAGDRCEQEADRVAGQVAHQHSEAPPSGTPRERPRGALARSVTPIPRPMQLRNTRLARQEAKGPGGDEGMAVHGPEGGAVEPGVEGQIQSARGGGRRLDARMRGAGGAAAQRELVQRDLGFEYAIPWHARQRRYLGEPKAYGKKHELYTSAEFNMETDGIEIEFVVNPIKDAAGEAGVVTVFDRLENHVGLMEQERARALAQDQTNLLHPPLPFVTSTDSWLEIDTRGEAVQGAPQATIGVKLESVPMLYQGLSDQTNKDNDELIGMNAGGKTHAAKIQRAVSYNWGPVNGNPPSAKLKGLLAMVALVLNQGNAPIVGAGAPTVKYLMILMSRTQFGHLFNQIDDGEKTYFNQNPDEFVDYICNTMALNADDNVITWKIHDGNTLKNYSADTHGYWPFTWKGRDQRITIDIKRKAWLTAMTTGRDILTAEANPIGYMQNKTEFQDTRGYGHRLRGMGGLDDKMDDLAGGGKGAIMEMRVMKKPVPYKEWKEQAVSIFRYVQALNERAGVGPTPKYKRANLKQEKQDKDMADAQEARLKEDSDKRRTLNQWG